MTTTNRAQAEIAAMAARLIVDEGFDHGAAKRRAAQALGHRRGVDLPSHELVEDAVREHLALFHADTQPGELVALRQLALRWMKRLSEFRPHVGGAVWRGTATRRSTIHLDLYCDDAKSAEIALINLGVSYEHAPSSTDQRGEPMPVLLATSRCAELGIEVPLTLTLHDHDALRGALKPDARGQTWRGDAAALARRLAEGDRDDQGKAAPTDGAPSVDGAAAVDPTEPSR